MTLEIHQVEGSRGTGGAAPSLKTPRGGQPGPVRKLDVSGRPNKQRLPGEFVETDALIFAQIARLAAEEKTRSKLRHHRDCGADRGLLLCRTGTDKARPFRLIGQVESR